jgi:hypothetical protein
MNLFKMETKHRVVLHDSLIVGVEQGDQTKGNQDQAKNNKDQEEEEDSKQEQSREQSIDEPSQEDEESDLKEELQGKVQPNVCRSTRKIKKQQVLNMKRHEQRSYQTQLNQVNTEVEYDAQDAKVIVIIMCHIQEKQVVGTQHVITYSLKSSLKRQAEDAALKEMKQMIDG